MRFRKSIKIMKGVRVNFSKSGLSLTAGVRGASVNFGPRGTYLNTGIPGTGIYDRTRIGGTNNSAKSRATGTGSKSKSVEMAITIGIEDDGTYFIRNQDGTPIADESILRKIKRTEAYKARIFELGEKFLNDKNEESQVFIDIYKLSPTLVSEIEIRQELESLRPILYIRRAFDRSVPEKVTIEAELSAQAQKNIRSLAFWTLKRRRLEYVNNNLESVYEKVLNAYNQEKQNFLFSENETERTKNAELAEVYEKQKADLVSALSGDQKWVEGKVDLFLSAMTLPVDFSVAYEYESAKRRLSVDLDLPEIEDLPTTKATSLSSGKVKVKEKTQKEIKEEYIRCISGLAFFFACSLFNISTNISSILLSGYTQRLNKKIGKIEDEYVYSIIFDRTCLSSLEVTSIDPVAAFENFPNRRSISKTFEVATVTPFSGFEDNL